MINNSPKRYVEVSDFSCVKLDPLRLAYFKRYFRTYYYDTFRYGQGTEEILAALAKFGRGGDWIDLGSGPSTLFWSLPLCDISSITCSDISIEALKVLHEFVHSDELPECYRQVLSMFSRPITHLAEMRRRVGHYYILDAMKAWPDELETSCFDLITQFGTFGLAPSPENFISCFGYLRPHLNKNGFIIGASWIRSNARIREDGHDNSYLNLELIRRAADRYNLKLLQCNRVEILGDPLFVAVCIWSMTTY